MLLLALTAFLGGLGALTHVVHDDVVGLGKGAELSPLGALLGDHEGDRDEERKDGGEGKLVANVAEAVRDAGGGHELGVLLALEGGEEVGEGGGEESGPGKVELLDRGEDNTTDDGDEAEPLRQREEA
jgi:hypothetical protein